MHSQQRMPVLGYGLVVLLTFATVSTAPSDTFEGLALSYEPGKTYTYDYETESVITLAGTTGEESKVNLKGQALLTVTKKNDFVLTLRKFALDAKSPNEKAAVPLVALEETSSRFTTEGGAIKDFYITGTETAFVANYHRAVASIFNNHALKENHDSRTFHYESDVSGKDCPTEYQITSDSTFTKRRDLNKCQNRDGGYTVQFGIPSAKKRSDDATSDTAIRSTQECTLKYAGGFLDSAQCSEDHKVTFLASGNAGGKAKVTAKLQLKSKGQDKAQLNLQSPTPSKLSSIYFDHSGTYLKKTDDATATEVIEALVSKLALSIGANGRLSSNTAADLLTLKSKLRFVSGKVLKEVYGKLKAGTLGSSKAGDEKHEKVFKLFLDAAAMAGSSESIAFVADLIKSGSVNANTQKRFRLYTAFADRPKESALGAMKDILASGKDVNPKYFLTASGIAHQYCLAMNEDCKSNAAYVALVNEIAKQTETNCASADKEKVKAAVIGLQGLGNLDSLTQPALTAISSCLQKSDRIKVQALQAFRRDPCQDSLRAESRKLLKNAEHQPHVRISAYLALAQCYDKSDSDTLRTMLKTEESVQVLSFIKSHRENAWSQCKKVAEMDADLFTEANQSKIQNDPRKFSSAISYNSGMESFSSNVIYSEDSFLPRIVYGNSSLKYFGRDYPLLEAGAHLGELEQEFWEKMYGPTGKYKDSFQSKSTGYGGYRRRPKRQASVPTVSQNEIQVFQSQVKVEERKVEPSDIYFRLFGTTIYANSFTLEELYSTLEKPSVEALLKKAGAEGIHFTESYPLYGDELSVPTVSGLSLIIHNEGAAVMSLKYSHSLSPEAQTFSPKFKPGVSIANNMKMSIAAEIIEAGLRAQTKAAAASDISLTGTLKATDDHYGLEVRIAMPNSAVNLVDASNELYWTLQTRHADYDHLQRMTTVNQPQLDTGLKCAKILPILTGLQACVSAQIPPIAKRNIPHFPLSGSAHVSLKLDPPTSAKELVLNFKFPKPESNSNEKIVLLEIDTPGSSTNNKAVLSATLSKHPEEGYNKVSLKLDAPTLKAEITGEATVGTPGVKDITFKAKVDNDQYELLLKRRQNVNAPKDVDSRSFGIIYTLPGEKPATILQIEREASIDGAARFLRKLDFTLGVYLISSSENEEFVQLTYNVEAKLGSDGKVTEGSIKDFKFTYPGNRMFLINGAFKPGTSDASALAYELDVKLNILGSEQDGKVNGELIRSAQKNQLKGTMSSTTHATLNSEFSIVRETESGFAKTVIDIKQVGASSLGGTVFIDHSFDTRRGEVDISYNSKVLYPPKNYNSEKVFTYKSNDKQLTFNLKLSKNGKAIVDAMFEKTKSSSDYTASILVTPGASGPQYSLSSKKYVSGDKTVLEQSVKSEPGFSGSAKTEIFETGSNKVVIKNHKTVIQSSELQAELVSLLKYEVNAQKPSIIPKLITNGYGVVDYSIEREGNTVVQFYVSNKEEAAEIYELNLKAKVDQRFDYKFLIKCMPKEEKVDISSSMQAPLKSGPLRITKISVYGKVRNDAPGERNFGATFDHKGNGEDDKTNVIHVESRNRYNHAGSNVALSSEVTCDSYGQNRKFVVDINAQVSKSCNIKASYKDEQNKTGELTLNLAAEIDPSTKYITLKHDLKRRNGNEAKGSFGLGLRNFNKEKVLGELQLSYELENNGAVIPIYKFVVSSGVDAATQARNLGFVAEGLLGDAEMKYSGNVEVGKNKYQLKFRGGNAKAKSLKLIEVGIQKSIGANLKKYTIELAQDFDFQEGSLPKTVGTATLAYRFDSIRDFEYQDTGVLDIRGEKVYHFDYSRVVKASPGLFDLETKRKMILPGKAPHEASGKIKVINNDKKFNADILIQTPELYKLFGDPDKTTLKVEFETTKDISHLELRTKGTIPSKKFESFSLSVDRKVDASARHFRLNGFLGNKGIDFTSDIKLGGDQKSAEITVKLPDQQTTRNLKIKYDAKARSTEATYEYGNGEKLTAVGTVTKADKDDFAANFVFNTPNLKGELAVANEQTDSKRVISLSAKSPDTNQLVVFNYKREKSAQHITLSGDLKVDLNAMQDKLDFDGEFNVFLLPTTYTTGKNVPGKSFSAELKYVVGADKRSRSLNVNGGASEAEKRFSGKLCLKTECTEVVSKLKTAGSEKSYEYSVTKGDIKMSSSMSYSLSKDWKTKLASFRTIYVNPSTSTSRDIGLSVYMKPGTAADLDLTKSDIPSPPSQVHISGIEITVPARTYAAQLSCGDWNDVDARAGEATLWFDKKKSPDQKLGIGYSMKKPSVQEQGQGRDITLILRHHKLQRDLKFTTSYRYGITSKVFELKAEIDVFKKAEDKLVYNLELIHNVPSESYTLESGLRSQGQGISVVMRCKDVKIDHPHYQLTCTQVEKVPGEAPETVKITMNLQLSENDFKEEVEVVVGTERIYYSKAAIYSFNQQEPSDPAPVKDKTVAANFEIQFPGMSDTRYINVRSSRNPRRFSISTNPSSSKTFTSFWVGATSVLGGGWGISRQNEAGTKQNLANFDAVIIGKRLEIDMDWNKQQIADYLAYALKRGQEVEKQVLLATDKLVGRKQARRNALIRSLKAAAQDCEPVYQWFETKLSEIGKKYNMGPVKIPRSSLLNENSDPLPSIFLEIVQCTNKALTEGAVSLNRFLDTLSKRPSLPREEDVKKQVATVVKFAEEGAKTIRKAVAAIKPYKEKYPVLQKYGTKIRENVVTRIQNFNDESREDIIAYFPYPEVEHLVDHFNDYIEVALLQPEQISEANKTEMLGDFEKAAEKILRGFYDVDFQQGHLTARIPLFKSKRSQIPLESYNPKECASNVRMINENPAAIFPPVNATAFLVGNSHYVTFDGTVGRFEKTCQYLMASDFVNKNFSVVFDLGSDASGVGSAIFVSDHTFTVGILREAHSLSLVVNGKVVRLDDEPVEAGSFIGYKDGDYVMIDSAAGVTVGCTNAYNLCAVQVSGFYHGKLQGVFGKFNNEPHDDLTLPTGKVTENDGVFQKSWKLNKDCPGKAIRKSDIPSELSNELGPRGFDIDTFFTRSKYSTHKKLQQMSTSFSALPMPSFTLLVLSLFVLLAKLIH